MHSDIVIKSLVSVMMVSGSAWKMCCMEKRSLKNKLLLNISLN